MPNIPKYEAVREQILTALRSGATEDYACSACRPQVTRRALAKWKLSKPGFKEEVEDAKTIPDSIVRLSLFRAASGRSVWRRKPIMNRATGEPVLGPSGDVLYEEQYHQPNVIAMIFWLKNRQPDEWKDRHELDAGDKPILVEIIERSETTERPAYQGE